MRVWAAGVLWRKKSMVLLQRGGRRTRIIGINYRTTQLWAWHTFIQSLPYQQRFNKLVMPYLHLCNYWFNTRDNTEENNKLSFGQLHPWLLLLEWPIFLHHCRHCTDHFSPHWHSCWHVYSSTARMFLPGQSGWRQIWVQIILLIQIFFCFFSQTDKCVRNCDWKSAH